MLLTFLWSSLNNLSKHFIHIIVLMTPMIASICTRAHGWFASKYHMQNIHSIWASVEGPHQVQASQTWRMGCMRHTQEIRCLHHSTSSTSYHKYICAQVAVMQQLQQEYNQSTSCLACATLLETSFPENYFIQDKLQRHLFNFLRFTYTPKVLIFLIRPQNLDFCCNIAKLSSSIIIHKYMMVT